MGKRKLKGALKEGLKDSGKFLLHSILVFIPVLFIHELGHMIVQILVGFPINFGFNFPRLGISTTAGLGIMKTGPNVFYPLAFAGFIATIIPIKYLKDKLWFPEELKKYSDINQLKTIWYIFMCLGIAYVDFALIVIYTIF